MALVEILKKIEFDSTRGFMVRSHDGKELRVSKILSLEVHE
jgi:hypothetical protein